MKRILITLLAVVALLSSVAVVANAISINVTTSDYGEMLPTDAKFTKTTTTVRAYGNYDYLNFYINSVYDDKYFFYEIYADEEMKKPVASDYVYCETRGKYTYSPWIKLKGVFKTGTYYGVTYAAEIDDEGNVSVSQSSFQEFKFVVNRTTEFKRQIVLLKNPTNTVNGPTIKWYKLSNNVSKYVVYRRSMTGTKWYKVATVNGNTYSYTDKSLKNKNAKYIYTVKAIDKKGVASRYQYNGPSVLFAKAPVVSSVATASDNRVQVKWNRTSSLAVYRVYRSENGGSWKLIKNNYNSNVFYDTTAKNGVTYKYTVRAVIPTAYGNAISSYYSGKATTFTAAPALNPVQVSDNGLKITWSAVEGATAYTVYRKSLENGASWGALKKVKAGVTEYVDTTANENSAFIYTVRSEGKTSRGSYINAGVEYFVFDKPVITSVESFGSGGYHTINWNGDNRASSFNIYVKENNEWELLGSVSSLARSYTYTKKSLFGKLEFRVEAVRGALTSISDPYEYESYPDVNVTAKENLVAGNRLQWEVFYLAEKYNLYRATVDKDTGEKTQYELIETFEVSETEKYLEFFDADAIDGVNYVYKINSFYYGKEHENTNEIKIFRSATDAALQNEKIELVSYNSYRHPDASNKIYITLGGGDGIQAIYYFYNYQTGNWIEIFSHYRDGERHEISESQLEDKKIYPNADGEYKMAVVYMTGNNGGVSEKTSIDRNVQTVKFLDEYVESITAELTAKKIKLSWANVEGATKYIVKYTDKNTFKENTVEVEKSATDTTECYLSVDLETDCTYEVELTTIYEDGSKIVFSGKEVFLHGIPKITHIGKYVSKVDGAVSVYVYLEDMLTRTNKVALYRKAPNESSWKFVKYLEDFTSISSQYGCSYLADDSEAGLAYTYTARYIADECKDGAKTDVGSWYDEKGTTRN